MHLAYRSHRLFSLYLKYEVCRLNSPGQATRQQTSTKQHISLLEASQQIISEQGYQGLWAGLEPSVFLAANPAITYGIFARLKSLVIERRMAGRLGASAEDLKISIWTAFMLGAFAKALATIVSPANLLFH